MEFIKLHARTPPHRLTAATLLLLFAQLTKTQGDAEGGKRQSFISYLRTNCIFGFNGFYIPPKELLICQENDFYGQTTVVIINNALVKAETKAKAKTKL